jgi:hypothetical protein
LEVRVQQHSRDVLAMTPTEVPLSTRLGLCGGGRVQVRVRGRVDGLAAAYQHFALKAALLDAVRSAVDWLSDAHESTLGRMSIADGLRREQVERLRLLDVSARLELAFALGRRDVALFVAAQAVTEAEARRRLRAGRRTGRVPSSCAGE